MSELWARIAKLAGLLGSEHDGEIAAAARKIGELLRREGLSWPDFARRLANGIEKPIAAPAPKPKRQRKPPPPPQPPRDADIGKAGYPYWRHDVQRLTVWAYCFARTERGLCLQMSHRVEPIWLPRSYVWRSYIDKAPPDEEWQEWSIEGWLVRKQNLAESFL